MFTFFKCMYIFFFYISVKYWITINIKFYVKFKLYQYCHIILFLKQLIHIFVLLILNLIFYDLFIFLYKLLKIGWQLMD